MNNIYIYVIVVLLTIFICSGYGVYYVSKVIINQKNIEEEILKIVKENVNTK